MKILRSFLTALIVFISLIAIAQAEPLKTEIQPSEITLGESFRVIYTLEGQTQITPDFNEFQQDFSIMGKNHSLRMTIINGRSSMISTWELTLLAKREGQFTLPSVLFGKFYSEKKTVKVLPPHVINVAQPGTQKLFMIATLDNAEPYVQSQATYTVKLYYSTSLSQGNIADPDVPDAVVFRIGNDKQYQAQYRKQLYNIVERNYAIFPQKSGEFIIKPAVFTGIEQIPGDLLSGKPIRTGAAKVTLKVRDIPQAALGYHWVPAKTVTVEESWQNLRDNLAVGDPVTRTIIIHAEGLTSGQLPDLADKTLPGFNVYPDKSVNNDSVENNMVVGQRKERIAYIPTNTGQLTIPALNLYWWNTQKDRLEVLTLPERALTIAGTGSPTSQAPANTTQKTATSSPTAVFNTDITGIKEHSNKFIIVSAVLVLWFALLFWYWRRGFRLPTWWRRKSLAAHKQLPNRERTQEKIALKLKSACNHNDPVQAKQALLAWASTNWPQRNIRNLGQLAIVVGSGALSEEIKKMAQTLYAPEKKSWRGDVLWQAFNNYKQPKEDLKTRDISGLPPLYPEY